jgi:hypothetical protein
MIHTVAHEVRQAVRRLRTDRGFTVAAVLLLGLGIGVNNMMFTVIYGHTLRKLPIDDPDRVLYISSFDDRAPDRPLSYPDLEDLDNAAGFTGFAAWSGGPVTLADDDGAPERVEAAYVSANAFELIGRVPIAGRTFTAEEDLPVPVHSANVASQNSVVDRGPDATGRQGAERAHRAYVNDEQRRGTDAAAAECNELLRRDTSVQE